MLRADLASLGLQRCSEPLPSQKHPFCVWKHQGDGRGRQIKCISQTRMRLKTTRQTKRARKSRTKVEALERKAISLVRLQHDFMCPDLSPPITASAVRAPHLKKTRHGELLKVPCHLTSARQRAALTCPSAAFPGTRRRGARRYPWLYRAGPGRRSGRDSQRSRRRRVPLRQLHVKSPAAAPGAPMLAGGVTRQRDVGNPPRVAIGMFLPAAAA